MLGFSNNLALTYEGKVRSSQFNRRPIEADLRGKVVSNKSMLPYCMVPQEKIDLLNPIR